MKALEKPVSKKLSLCNFSKQNVSTRVFCCLSKAAYNNITTRIASLAMFHMHMDK